MKKAWWGLLSLALGVALAACGSSPTTQSLSSNSFSIYSLSQNTPTQSPSSTSRAIPPLSIPSQKAAVTPPVIYPQPSSTPSTTATLPSTPPPASNCVTYSNATTWVPAKNGTLAAPYGPAPISSEAQQLTQQLFQLINSDRAACGLSPFAWSDTLAKGALLHSWNMAHCGFSHTCPDGSTQYQRIANEGFAGLSDCGENIGLAGPSNPPWINLSSVQESMAHEPLGGWHRIHLYSTTLHRIGIGIYVDSGGWLWFTEDMVA